MIYDLSNNTDRNKAIERFKKLLEGKNTIELTKKIYGRSIAQNRLYWLWLSCIQDETGNDKNDLHIYFKEKYLNSKTVNVLGKFINKSESTKELDTTEMANYLKRIDIFSQTELNIKLLYPEDLGFDVFYDKYKHL
jgi:hypothetical protein